MHILAVATGTRLPSLLEQHYLIESLAVLPDYESGLAHLSRGRYDAVLAGDSTPSLDNLQAFLQKASTMGDLKTVFLTSPRTAGFPVPDGVLILSGTSLEAEIATALALVRRPLEGNRIVIFHTIKGGVGKTTVTINTAVALKQLNPDKQIVIWDQDLPKGNIGLAFGQPNALTIEHLLREPKLKPDVLERHLYLDKRTGVHLLLAPGRTDIVIQLQANPFFDILSLLQARFHYVLLDFEPEIHRNEILVLGLHRADDLVLVTDYSEFSLNALTRLMPILTALGVQNKVRLVFNNVWEDLDRRQLEETWQVPVLGIVSSDRRYEFAHREHKPPTDRKLIAPFREIATRLAEL